MKFNNSPESSDNSNDEKLNEESNDDVTSMENEEEEGDEIDDEDDYVDEAENVNAKKDEVLQRISIGGANKKIILKNSKTKIPTTQKLVDEAIRELNERGGSSVEAITKYIIAKYPELNESRLKLLVKRYIKNCLTDGIMVQIKRSFKLTKKYPVKMKEKQKDQFTTKNAKQQDNKTDKKTATNKETSVKKINKVTKTTEKANKETPKKEVNKISKLEKGTKENTEPKKKEKIELKTKSAKSNNLLLKPTSSSRPKSTNDATKEVKKPKFTKESASDAAVSTAATVKASGRAKKK